MSVLGDMAREFAKEYILRKPLNPPKKIIKKYVDMDMRELKKVMKKKLNKNVDKINICQQAVINEMKLNPMFLKCRID